MNTLTISMALMMGLTGSLHCAGMCGPIIWIMPFQKYEGVKKWLGIGLYHFGRISVYALLGWILYSFKSIFCPQWQQYISIGLGALLLVAGVVAFIPNSKIRIMMPWVGAVRKLLSGYIGRPGLSTLLAAGILNGLLPCGLVYMALSASMFADSSLNAVITMYAFGLGTVPMLVGLTLLRGKAGFVNRLSVRKLVPVAMFVFGCLFMVRGMNLGIPYLSPRVTIENQEVKTSCCHKN